MFNLQGFKTPQVFATVKKIIKCKKFHLYIHVYDKIAKFISVDSVHKHYTHSGSK